MDKFAQHIDKLIQKVLNEAAEEKATEVSEKLHGGQKNLDKNKNNKIDAEDFKLLRKKKETKEQFEQQFKTIELEYRLIFKNITERNNITDKNVISTEKEDDQEYNKCCK